MNHGDVSWINVKRDDNFEHILNIASNLFNKFT